MYLGLVCLVLFDARGSETDAYGPVAALLAVLMFLTQYLPRILHRQHLIDALCEDLLHVTTHALCCSVVRPPLLRYACALHGACFLLQHRLPATIFVHTVTAACLVLAYIYGPRITELQPFIIAVACPHAVDVLARALVHLHRLLVLWAMDF